MLIGTNNGHLIAEKRASVQGSIFEPIARETDLGWTAAGYVPTGIQSAVDIVSQAASQRQLAENALRQVRTDAFDRNLKAANRIQVLEERLKAMLEITDRFNAEHGWPDENLMTSQLDQYCLDKLEKDMRMVDGKMQLPCLWKRGEPKIRSNFNFAKQRLDSLIQSKHMKDPKVRAAVNETFSNYEKEGIVKRITVENPHEW